MTSSRILSFGASRWLSFGVYLFAGFGLMVTILFLLGFVGWLACGMPLGRSG